MDASMEEKLLALFESKLSRQMLLNLETCSHCGLCSETCHAYASQPFIQHTPAWRAEVVRRIYKNYFTSQGRLLPALFEAKPLSETAVAELKQAASTCTGCRRCTAFCPFGVDTQQIVSIAKLLLIGAGEEPGILSMLADMSVAKGESYSESKDSFLAGLKRLEAEVLAKWQSQSEHPIPVDVLGADTLYVALAGAHSIIPAAAIFNAARENWSLSFFEAVNFGAFVGDPAKTKLIMQRIIDEAIRLKVKRVCVCECGTAYRVLKQQSGPQPFEVVSITALHAEYLRTGRIKARKLAGSYTYHDPCQIARNAGVIDEPRYILSQIAQDYREMSPEPGLNWCCGGGGGLVALGEETLDFRMRSSRVKAEQIKVSRAEHVVTACENCHTQLENINAHYGLGVQVSFLSSLLADALVK